MGFLKFADSTTNTNANILEVTAGQNNVGVKTSSVCKSGEINGAIRQNSLLAYALLKSIGAENENNISYNSTYSNYQSTFKTKFDAYVKTIQVDKAGIANYASSDTSKGTIEERLTKLGFKSGIINFAGSDYGSTTETDTTQNGVFRLGNFVIGNINATLIPSATIIQNYFTTGKVVLTLPTNFIPKTAVTVPCVIYQPETSNSSRFGYISINPSNGQGTFIFNTQYGSFSTSVNADVRLHFGFEANPIV